MIVIGGLISNKQARDDSKVPLVGDVPWFGGLFTKKDHQDKRTELVVLLQSFLISND
jgi:type II secretory pathway component GspD/PulD (secretin)